MWNWKSESGPTGIMPVGPFTGVLPGEQAASKTARQGSTPCTGADCRRGSTEKGAGLVNRIMLVRIQSSALESVPML